LKPKKKKKKYQTRKGLRARLFKILYRRTAVNSPVLQSLALAVPIVRYSLSFESLSINLGALRVTLRTSACLRDFTSKETIRSRKDDSVGADWATSICCAANKWHLIQFLTRPAPDRPKIKPLPINKFLRKLAISNLLVIFHIVAPRSQRVRDIVFKVQCPSAGDFERDGFTRLLNGGGTDHVGIRTVIWTCSPRCPGTWGNCAWWAAGSCRFWAKRLAP